MIAKAERKPRIRAIRRMTDENGQPLGRLVPARFGQGWTAYPATPQPAHLSPCASIGEYTPKAWVRTIALGFDWLKAYRAGDVAWIRHPSGMGGTWAIRSDAGGQS